MTLTVALLVHLVAFWSGAWLVGSPATEPNSWLLCYLAGATVLVAARWLPSLRLGTNAALQVIGYAALLALLFWGANMALDLLGNSVRARRLPPELRTGLPLHFILVPGVASVALAALVAGLLPGVVVQQRTTSVE